VNTQRNFHLLACSPPKLPNHPHQHFTRYSGIRDAIIFCIHKALSHSFSERHSDKVDWSGKNADFSTLTGCHGNIPEKSKKLKELSKPLHPSTNPEILVKIAPLASELRGLECRPLKKIKK